MSRHPVILAIREDCEFSRELRGRGYEVLNLPLISTRPAADLGRFRRVLSGIGRFDAIFITSPAAAKVLADELDEEMAARLPTVYVLGGRAKKVLEDRGIMVEYREAANTTDDLLDELGESGFAGETILFLRGDKSLRAIPERLARVAAVEEAIVYESVEVPIENEEAVDRLRSKKVDWVCFFSPSAVESYAGRGLPLRVRAAAIGDTTAARARSLGIPVGFVSGRASAIEFARGLARHIKSFE